MATIVSWRYTLGIRRYVLHFDNRRRVYVKTVRAILKMEEEIQRQILSIGIALDDECHETHMLMKALTSKFGPIKGNVKPDPVMTSWRFDDETDMVTITYDSGEQQVYWLDHDKAATGFHGRIA
ncbi:hypothetical protein HanIR_Chr09g0441191 [Helianthus annuus]|nr:hypothetical protein HanIR_Chr09g0441191 [Helianthus annuus]